MKAVWSETDGPAEAVLTVGERAPAVIDIG